MNYPTPTFIRNLTLCSLAGKYADELDDLSVGPILSKEYEGPLEGTKEGNELIEYIVAKFDVDLDDCVYDQISIFDGSFENDPEWFDEEEHCEKDRIRDQVLELIGV